MDQAAFELVEHEGPVLATAIHDGTLLRPEVASLMQLPENDRVYEEDPYTREFIPAALTSIVVNTSRFEVDLNRPRDNAVYVTPEQSWGLEVWRDRPPQDLIERSLEIYDGFYAAYRSLLRKIIAQHGSAIVMDLHSYNHRRDGAGLAPAPAAENPEVNLGTRTMPPGRWTDAITTFSKLMSEEGFDVRENVRFGGGHLAQWTHTTFPETACVLSVEFKKVFMDEWTGEVDGTAVARINTALSKVARALSGLAQEPSS